MFLVAVVGIGAYTDYRWGKLYNWLTMPAALLGVILNTAIYGWLGLGDSLAGFALGFGLFFGLFVMKAMAGGDVKLVAAIGALGGFKFTIAMILYTAVAGGILAFWWSAKHGTLTATARRFKQMIQAVAIPGITLERPLSESDSPPFPYGLAIAAGTLLQVAFPEWLHL